jgi:hypothetical protein
VTRHSLTSSDDTRRPYGARGRRAQRHSVCPGQGYLRYVVSSSLPVMPRAWPTTLRPVRSPSKTAIPTPASSACLSRSPSQPSRTCRLLLLVRAWLRHRCDVNLVLARIGLPGGAVACWPSTFTRQSATPAIKHHFPVRPAQRGHRRRGRAHHERGDAERLPAPARRQADEGLGGDGPDLQPRAGEPLVSAIGSPIWLPQAGPTCADLPGRCYFASPYAGSGSRPAGRTAP